MSAHRTQGESMVFDRIASGLRVLAGVPCIRGLRVPVAVGMVADGMSAEEILPDFPHRDPEDVPEALRYAAEAARERESPLHPVG